MVWSTPQALQTPYKADYSEPGSQSKLLAAQVHLALHTNMKLLWRNIQRNVCDYTNYYWILCTYYVLSSLSHSWYYQSHYRIHLQLDRIYLHNLYKISSNNSYNHRHFFVCFFFTEVSYCFVKLSAPDQHTTQTDCLALSNPLYKGSVRLGEWTKPRIITKFNHIRQNAHGRAPLT